MIANLVTASRIVLLVPLYVFMTMAGPGAAWAALVTLVLAGLTDVVDGRIARALNQVSALGAMLDLISDRLLTVVLIFGLMAGGQLAGPWIVAGLVLLGRDLVVASFGEALKGAVRFPVTAVEKVKIALQFAGFGLLVAPPVVAFQHDAGRWALAASAALCLATLVGYTRTAVAAIRA